MSSEETKTTWEQLPDLMSTEVCAEYLGMKKGFVCTEIQRKRLQALRIGRYYKVPKKCLRAYLEAKEKEWDE